MKKIKPKLCFVSPEIYPVLIKDCSIMTAGGAEVQQSILIRELDRRGYDISVITFDYGQNDLVKLGKNIKVYKYGYKNQGLGFVRYFYPLGTNLLKLMKKVDADIYYQRVASMITGIVAFFCQRHGKKFIFSLASDKDAMQKMITEYNKISLGRDLFFYKYGLRNAHVVICQNEFQKKKIKKDLGINGIIIKSAYSLELRKTNKNAEKKKILWVGSLIKNKRPEFFIRLSKNFKEKFVLVGKAESQDYLNSLKNIPHNNNLSFEGFVPYCKIDAYFDNAKLLVNTSIFEGFPNTFLQAWSRGIPVISSVDPSQVIRKNNAGYFCESLDEFKFNINLILKDKKLYSTICENCKKYFKQNHTVKTAVDEYEKVFTKLINKK